MNKTTLILDLDGVLITNPIWKPDEIEEDGYSKFNEECIANLNELLSQYEFEIWLSSSRRRVKTLEEFNLIFANRNIIEPIKSFIPIYDNCKNRKEEIIQFIDELAIENYLILDDDKSLLALPESKKQKLVLTSYFKGFDKESLTLAIEKIINNE